MASTFSLRAQFQRFFQVRPSLRSILPPSTSTLPRPVAAAAPSAAPFSTTAPASARAAPAGKAKRDGKRGGSKHHQPQQDPKIVSMKKHLSLLSPRRIPAPLRMARNRHLRHWTVHRAWLLFRRARRDARARELARMYRGMELACEELRATAGPGTRDEGYLFRVAMEKKGVYGRQGVPVEYARMQTETPAREPWNHGWKRAAES